MGKSGWIRKPSKQITIIKGRKSLLEFENCMRPPSIWFPWHLQAEGLEGEEKRSLIRVIMVDYSGEKSVSVYANLRPKEIKWLYHHIFMMIDNVSFSQQKIYKVDKQSNEGMVTYISINRYETDMKGEKRELPWRIEIQNGTGIVSYNSIGGQYCQKGSYKKKKAVTINLSDADTFMLFDDVIAVIRASEKEHLFHRRDVENMEKLLKFYKISSGNISNSLKQIMKLLEHFDKKNDDMAA